MSVEFKEIFGELLQKSKKTAYDLSKSTNISQGLLSDYKKGRSVPTNQNLIKIADFFDVSVDYLLGRDKPLSSIINNGSVSGVQGVNHGTVSIKSTDDKEGSLPQEHTRQITEIDGVMAEIVNVISKFNKKNKAAVLTFIYDLEEKEKQKK